MLGFYISTNAIQAYETGPQYFWPGDHTGVTDGQVCSFDPDDAHGYALNVSIVAGRIEPKIYPNGFKTPTVILGL